MIFKYLKKYCFLASCAILISLVSSAYCGEKARYREPLFGISANFGGTLSYANSDSNKYMGIAPNYESIFSLPIKNEAKIKIGRYAAFHKIDFPSNNTSCIFYKKKGNAIYKFAKTKEYKKFKITNCDYAEILKEHKLLDNTFPIESLDNAYPLIKESKDSLQIDFARVLKITKIECENSDANLSAINIKFAKDEECALSDFAKLYKDGKELSNLEIVSPNAEKLKLKIFGKELEAFKFSDGNNNRLPFCQAFESLNGKSNVEPYLVAKWLGHIYPVEWEWLMCDLNGDISKLICDENSKLKELNKLLAKYSLKESKSIKETISTYVAKKQEMRKEFLAQLKKNDFPTKYVYVQRYTINPSFYGYTEALSDARGETVFSPKSRLCMLSIGDDMSIKSTVLIDDAEGVIRDVDVSFDAKKILFSWKKSAKDNYSLYEMDIASKEIKLLSRFKDCADIEGKYLPNGEIIFNSTMCGTSTDCWNTEVSNLYIMNVESSSIRRVGFDQVSTTYPTLCENSDIIYTRWDYNDRGQMFTQGVFAMKMDGSFQRELYGNKSWYPTAIGHTRQIPNQPNKYMCILHGHHTAQCGKLAMFDVSLGRNEGNGLNLLLPTRTEKPHILDDYGQIDDRYEYPYPLSEDLFFVSGDLYIKGHHNHEFPNPFSLYLFDKSGRRELLASDQILNSTQIVPIAKRNILPIKSSLNSSDKKGYCLVRNVYTGYGSSGIKKGGIEKLRVVKLHYRNAPIGSLSNQSQDCAASSAICSTPIAIGNGAWDSKEILGEVPINDDGSVFFEVPAKEPIYFQLVDKNGSVVNTMRSWTAMQNGEFYSCMGCHGNRDESVKTDHYSKYGKPSKLKSFYGIKGGFSYQKNVQPILDNHCIKCHNDRDKARILSDDGKTYLSVSSLAKLENAKIAEYIEKNKDTPKRAFSLLNVPILNNRARRYFNDSYYNLLNVKMLGDVPTFADYKNNLINWLGAQSDPTLQKPYTMGSATSKLIKMLRKGHGQTRLSKREIDIISAWIDLYVPYCGDYYESNAWTKSEMLFYNYYQEKANRHNTKD